MEALLVLAGLWVVAGPVLNVIVLAVVFGRRDASTRLDTELFQLKLDHRAALDRLDRLERGAVRTAATARAAEPYRTPEPIEPLPTPPPKPVDMELPAAAVDAPHPPPTERDASASVPESLIPSVPQIAWERWLGVRGAAVLGALVLVLAGLQFFRYSVDAGLLTPTLRVVLGVVAGLGCVIASERPIRARHALLADWVAGAGVAILYLAFWAARSVYDLVGAEVAFALLVCVTAGATSLAVRRRSLPIALLGLFGGFATPALVASDSDRPLALFGYLLLLGAAVHVVARRLERPSLTTLGLVGASLYQVVWMSTRMSTDRVWLGLGVVLAFAGLFGLGARPGDSERRAGTRTRAAAILLPFALGLSFALRGDLGSTALPIGVLVVTLTLAACFAARRMGQTWLAIAAGASGVAVVTAFVVASATGEPSALADAAVPAALALLALAAVLHGTLELETRRPSTPSIAPAAARDFAIAAGLTTLGSLSLVLVLAGSAPATEAPALGAIGLALFASVLRQAGMRGSEVVAVFAAGLLGVGLPLVAMSTTGAELLGGAARHVALAVPVVAFAVAARLRRSDAARAAGHHATALVATAIALDVVASAAAYSPLEATVVLLASFAVALASARAVENATWPLVTTGVVVVVGAAWAFAHVDVQMPSSATEAIAVCGALAAAVLAAPFLHQGARASESLAASARAAAAATVFLLVPTSWAWRTGHGDAGAALVPAFLGALALAALHVARRRATDPLHAIATTWLGGAAIVLATTTVVMATENEWLTIGLASLGVGLLLLWRRSGQPALAAVALAHIAIAVVRVAANPAVLAYHERSDVPVFNWLAIAYGAPLALVLAARWILLTPSRDVSPPPPQDLLEIAARALAASAAVIGFVWLNVTILDAFSTGTEIAIDVGRRAPVRDLVLSLGWAAYSLGLLALGMRTKSAALRWASLVLVLLTVGKVFLHDLSELRDLYRVASLLGLAASLLVISASYQRFVFRVDQKA